VSGKPDYHASHQYTRGKLGRAHLPSMVKAVSMLLSKQRLFLAPPPLPPPE
jgi:hypothetical protein